MSSLTVTLIDVGWGDSILIEAKDDHDNSRYGLVDSNDTTNFRSSQIFLKRFFERRDVDPDHDKPIFDFVLLSHPHTDHGQGLKALMREFGTRQFWYPKSAEFSSLAYLLDYANRSNSVGHHQSIDDTKHLPALGPVALEVLWPPHGHIEPDPNDNSVVLVLRLNQVSFVLTGDAEAPVWQHVAANLPADARFFKVPHHGSVNGFFDASLAPAWLNHLPATAELGISAHLRPFHHPHTEVIDALNHDGRAYFRTDLNYHLSFTTDGQAGAPVVKYSHV